MNNPLMKAGAKLQKYKQINLTCEDPVNLRPRRRSLTITIDSDSIEKVEGDDAIAARPLI